MLKALLHGKLPRGIVDGNEGAEEVVEIEPTRREDPLTATVFERLSYLPPRLTWDILCRATKPMKDGPALPREAPLGAPTYSFWPSLQPGADGKNTNRVEPDVLISWRDTLLVVEAKHYGQQYAQQWIEQIRAVYAAPDHFGKRIWFIAVGGIVAHELEQQAADVRRELTNSQAGLLALRWEDLHHAIDELRFSDHAPEQMAILNDIATGLDAWGYRKKTWFSSLRVREPLVRPNKSLEVLRTWRER